MPKHRKPFITERASEFRKVNQANAEFADLIRELEYPAVRERIRSPDVRSVFRARAEQQSQFSQEETGIVQPPSQLDVASLIAGPRRTPVLSPRAGRARG